jgi:hydrogenase maturation protease
MEARMRTRLIGLGNPILTDDGVGIYAARAVQHILPSEAAVDVVELAVGGLTLMEAMIGFERVIVLDALWSPDGKPGQVSQFTAADLPDTMNTASAHDVDLPAALMAGRQLGAPLPPDHQIEIVAVQAQEVLTFGERPTPAVLSAIPEVVNRVLALLGYPLLTEPLVVSKAVLGGYDDIP